MLKNKEHLTQEGLKQIISIRASSNKGLSNNLKIAFPDLLPVQRPLIVDQEIKNPDWIAGFSSGDGGFMIQTQKSLTNKVGERVWLRFKITQHSRDLILLKSFINYFGCGNIYISKNGNHVDYTVVKFSDIIKKIIPFFDKYPILGTKQKDFEDFKLTADIIKNKEHQHRVNPMLKK